MVKNVPLAVRRRLQSNFSPNFYRMIRSAFRRRYVAIAQPQVVGTATALLTVFTGAPPPTVAVACVSLVGYVASLLFWGVFFSSFPTIGRRRQKMLLALYRIGQVACVSTAAMAIWSLAHSFGDVLHGAMIGLALLEFSNHFAIRWLDGQGRWFTQRSRRAWIGGAAGIALRHFRREVSLQKTPPEGIVQKN
jgi:hypothetical protein